jgi:hypothetical protein
VGGVFLVGRLHLRQDLTPGPMRSTQGPRMNTA